MQALVLAAGKGTRMRSARPKVLHEIFAKPLLGYVFDTLQQLGVASPAVVIGNGAEQVRSYLKEREKTGKKKNPVVLQREQKGTGHAVEMSRPVLGRYEGDILIWPGDMPLLTRETLEAFIEKHEKSGADVSVLSSVQPDPKGYGRILKMHGKLTAIREELDADEEERQVREVNTGVYLFNAQKLFSALKKVKSSNEKNEFYLTDTIEILVQGGAKVEAFDLASAEEAMGINSRRELSQAFAVINRREISKHQDAGVTFVSPEQTFVEPGAKIGEDTLVYPWTYIEAGVKIGKNCQIGPCAKLRKGTEIGDDSIIGSFVEVNRSKLGKNVFAKHLTYLGDATLGDFTNVGAGTITANFDGVNKHATKIGKKVLLGSNTVIVAPAVLEDGAKTGAGSVVTAGSRIRKGQVVVGVPAKPIKLNKRDR